MGKKPYILVVLGLLCIVTAFTVGGDTDPTCGRGRTMSPGEVCVDKATGEEQTYDEAKAQQGRQIQTFLPIIGGCIILYGGFTAFKRKRNPNWREAAAAKKQAAEARQQAAVAQYKARNGQTPMPGGQPYPPQQGAPAAAPMPNGQPYPPQQPGPAAPNGQPFPPQQSGPPPR